MSLYSSLFLISIYLWRVNKVTCDPSFTGLSQPSLTSRVSFGFPSSFDGRRTVKRGNKRPEGGRK